MSLRERTEPEKKNAYETLRSLLGVKTPLKHYLFKNYKEIYGYVKFLNGLTKKGQSEQLPAQHGESDTHLYPNHF